MLFNTDLPIEEAVPDIRRALEKGRSAVLEAPPGAGKTTVVPLALLNEVWLSGRRIIMLEPRRLAARAAAYRMAELIGEDVGKTVGYRTRLDSCIGPSTRIEVVTEGILTRFLQNDPSLEGAGLIIFDEFHERSVQADLGLALSLECRKVFREDIRILVMSATLDGKEVSGLLDGAPIIRSYGRAFPVEVRYRAKTWMPNRLETGPEFISRVVATVSKALREEAGSILVFLPGSGEIRRVEAGVKEAGVAADVDVMPLYGELPREQQDLAIRPPRSGRRKVVLATSIAETSLTIEGVKVVIDSGLKRVSRFSPGLGMSRLETIRVTKDSAEQRCGRAGRLEPGVCIRLWAEPENTMLKEKSTPEIMEADLAPLALELAVWGVKDPLELKWLDPPREGAMSYAREILTHLGAIDHAGKVTGHGVLMSKLPLHPRLSHMVLKGDSLGLGDLACHMSALLTERDIFKSRPDNRDSDIRHRLDALFGHKGHFTAWDIDRGLSERVKAAAKQLKRQLGIKDSGQDVDRAGLLLSFAYPDRIAKRRAAAGVKYLLANGRGAYLRSPEPIAADEYIVAASLDAGEKESMIFLAAPIKEAELEAHHRDEIEGSETVVWDQGQKGVAARRQRRLWNLILSDSPAQNPSKEKILEAFLSGIRQNGPGALPWDKASENLMARIRFLQRAVPGCGGFPALSDEWLTGNLEKWLGPWCAGMTRLEHLKKLDLKAVILGMLTWDEQRLIEVLAPEHITVPSGSRIKIDYSGEAPVLAVRLQEMFGMDRTPTIADGKVRLLIHLLSPALRPVQVTQDLAGFWANVYPLVKKEMKGRYPKHYWPDNPMEAEARRGAKRRGKD